MVAPVRLRQVVLITRDLGAVTARLEDELELAPGFQDEGVGYFGLENRVLAAGDCFIEVLTPVAEESAGYRYLERRGGADGGYMAIFQFDRRDGLRQRVADLGLRIVWQADLPDISGTHLDPRDVPGAIVSLDWADPPESWHWAGPNWRGPDATAASARPGGIVSLEVAVTDPAGAAATWAAVLGPGARVDGATISLDGAGQLLQFTPAPDRAGQGIVGCGLALAPPYGTHATRRLDVGGVRFTITPAAEADTPKEGL